MAPLRSAARHVLDSEHARESRANLLFRAFADETRLRILNLLRAREFCVGDIVAILDLPQPKVSQHLAFLRDTGLVRSRKEGQWHFYRLALPDGKLHRTLIKCLDCCLTEVPVLRTDSRRAKELMRRGGCCERS